MTLRIEPAPPPLAEDVQAAIDRVMRGRPPLLLFTTLARDRRLFHKFFAGGLLDPGHLALRQREIVICRTTALCRSEYEWGVHISAFGAHAGFSEVQVAALAHPGLPAPAAGWTADELLLLVTCDTLHTHCTLDDAAWQSLRAAFSEEAILEVLMLAGFYRTVSYLTNALDMPLEAGAARFPTGEETAAG